MNIIADEDLEREIVLALRVAGHVVLDIKESSPELMTGKCWPLQMKVLRYY